MEEKVLILVGPTASGKSALAVRIAKKFNGEVISADSRQVYRGLDIGTGKITKREMQGVPHHLLDIASPKRRFTADDFIQQAREAIAGIQKRGKLPIIAGGTGFYIDALAGRIDLGSAEPDEALRKKLADKTAVQLYALLQKKDRERAKAMDTPSERNNKVRLIRALEIAAYRIKSAPKDGGKSKDRPQYDALWIGIAPEMTSLDTKIKRRLSDRLKHGMIAEAKRLHAEGLSYKRMEELGLEYRYLSLFLRKKISRQELESQLYTAIRRYARKQVGYWRRNREIAWIGPTQVTEIEKMVKRWKLG